MIGPERDWLMTAFEVYASLALEQFEKAVVNFVSVVEIFNTLRSWLGSKEDYKIGFRELYTPVMSNIHKLMQSVKRSVRTVQYFKA